MKKLIIGAVAAASILAAAVPAFDGYFDPWGNYHPLCGWVFNGYGYIYICN